jgi:Trypsin-like peptidase domain
VILTSDGRTVAAGVVGTDQATDLAAIQAQGVSGLKAATLGDRDALEVGDTVLAVGDPLGLEGSVTAGIVSALHRSVGTDGSGGPLSDASVDGRSAGSIGVGLAIPSNQVTGRRRPRPWPSSVTPSNLSACSLPGLSLPADAGCVRSQEDP